MAAHLGERRSVLTIVATGNLCPFLCRAALSRRAARDFLPMGNDAAVVVEGATRSDGWDHVHVFRARRV